MIINNDPTNNIGSIYSQKVPPASERLPSAAGPAKDRPGGDEVSLSELAQMLQRARKALQGMPELREERVAALREQLSQGTYRVSEEEVAQALLRRGFYER